MAQKVLVVDDDPLTRRVLQHYLERGGYEVLRANNGHEAINIASRDLPALIILDLILPDMGGLEVLDQIQRGATTKGIPVILLSGNSDLLMTDEALKSGAAQALAKPINPEQLLAVMRKVLTKEGRKEKEEGR